MKRGILKNLIMTVLVLVCVIGLSKTQANAAKNAHEYGFVNNSTQTTATIEWSVDFYGDDVKVGGYKIYWNEGPFTDWNNYNFATAGGSEKSKTFTNLKPGTLYAVNVQATLIDKDGNELENMKVTHGNFVTLPSKVKNAKLSTKSTSTKLIVEFDQQTACDYDYLVTDLTGKKISKLSGSLTANYTLPGKVTIKDVDAKKKGYLISVRAKYKVNGKMVYGDWSEPVISLPAVTIKSATFDGKKIDLSWNAVANASEYAVLLSSSKNGTYTKVASTKKNVTKYSLNKFKGKALNKNGKYFVEVIAKVKVNKKTYKTIKVPTEVKKVK